MLNLLNVHFLSRRLTFVFPLFLLLLSSPTISQKPSFKWGVKEPKLVTKRAVSYGLEDDVIVIGDYHFLKVMSENETKVVRMIKLKVLEESRFDPTQFVEEASEGTALESIHCTHYTWALDETRNVVTKKNAFKRAEFLVDGKPNLELVSKDLRTGDVLELEYEFTIDQLDGFQWVGLSTGSSAFSEIEIRYPNFLDIRLGNHDFNFTESNGTVSKSEFVVDTLFQMLDVKKQLGIVNTSFSSKKWGLDQPPKGTFIAEVLQELNPANLETFKMDAINSKDVDFSFGHPFLEVNSDANGFIFYDKAVNNVREGFFEREMKIAVLKQEGTFLGDFETPVTSGKGGVLEKIEVTVYTKNGSRYEKHEIEEDAIFKVKIDARSYFYRFAAPNVKEGSFILVKYRLSNYYLYDWTFQHDVPVGLSEYKVIAPEVVRFNKKILGKHPIDFKEKILTTTIPSNEYVFTGENIPAFENEPFLSSTRNYKSAVNLSLTGVGENNYWPNWERAMYQLGESSSFGGFLDCHPLMKKEVKRIRSQATSDQEVIKELYRYVQDTFTWNSRLGFSSVDGQNKFMKIKSGNIGAINLTLTSMLQEAGLNAKPVITQTRTSGLMDITAPKFLDLNYVLCGVLVDGEMTLLDATDKNASTNVLPTRALNYFGVMLGEESHQVVELPGSSQSKEVVYINANVDKEGAFSGTVQRSFGGYAGYDLRHEIDSTSIERRGEKIEDAFLFLTMDDYELTMPEDNTMAVKEKFVVNNELDVASETFFNPFLFNYLDENPLKESERTHPVSLTETRDYTYIFNLSFPEDILIGELPQSEITYLSEDGSGGMIKVLYNRSPNQIQVTLKVLLVKDFFLPEEYPILRNFYDEIVKIANTSISISRT